MKSLLMVVALIASTSAVACGISRDNDDPHGFRNERLVGGKSRAQVHAETLEAARLGLLTWRGDTPPPRPTSQQEEQIRLAGLRAIGALATPRGDMSNATSPRQSQQADAAPTSSGSMPGSQ